MTSRIVLGMLVLVSNAARADEATDAGVTESVKQSPAGRFELGVGYNSDDGFVTGAKLEHGDLFGSGQRLSLQALVGERLRSVALAHEIPDVLGFELKTELFHSTREYQGFTREGAGGALTLGRRIDRDLKIFGRYAVEHVAMEMTDAARMPVVGGNLGDGILAMIGAGISYNTLDALERRGSRLELLAERSLGGDYQLERVSGLLQHARPLGPFTLRLQGHASYVRSRDSMGVPLAHRTFHDGHFEVRGFAFERGNPAGENAEATGRIDLELPIWKRAGLSLAVWADGGVRRNSDAVWGARGSEWQSSAGVSLVLRRPSVSIRIDLPLVVAGSRSDPQFLIGVGF